MLKIKVLETVRKSVAEATVDNGLFFLLILNIEGFL